MKKTRACRVHRACIYGESRWWAGDILSKQSMLHSEWRQHKTTAVAVCEAQASCSDAIASTTLPGSPNMNGECKNNIHKQHEVCETYVLNLILWWAASFEWTPPPTPLFANCLYKWESTVRERENVFLLISIKNKSFYSISSTPQKNFWLMLTWLTVL